MLHDEKLQYIINLGSAASAPGGWGVFFVRAPAPAVLLSASRAVAPVVVLYSSLVFACVCAWQHCGRHVKAVPVPLLFICITLPRGRARYH